VPTDRGYSQANGMGDGGAPLATAARRRPAIVSARPSSRCTRMPSWWPSANPSPRRWPPRKSGRAELHDYQRICDVLTGKDFRPEFKRLTSQERLAVLQIVRDTKPDVPQYW
jgi:hypothetical protein